MVVEYPTEVRPLEVRRQHRKLPIRYYDGYYLDRSKQISNSVVETMRKQELTVIEKDIERLVYSINSIEKLKKE